MLKNIRINLLSGSSYSGTLLSQKPVIPAPFIKKWLEHIIVLSLSHISYYSQPFHSSAVREEANYVLRWTLLPFLTVSPIARFFFSLCTFCLLFLFFVFAFGILRQLTELVIFKHQRKKLDTEIKIKLNRKRLYPSQSVRYLGIKIWIGKITSVILQ